MPAVHRLGDENDGGGVIESIAQGTVFVNGQLASIDGSSVSGHDLHLPTTTANGSTTVFIGGIPVNRLGDPDECGHNRAEGSPDVFIGNGDEADVIDDATDESPNLVSNLFSKPADKPVVADQQYPYQRTSPPPTAEQNKQAGTAPNNQGVTESPPITDQPTTECEPGKPSVLGFLQRCLAEASKGTWRETGQGGKPSNPNIIRMWEDIGVTWYKSDQVAWCAGFACFAMKQSGLKYIREPNTFNLFNKLPSTDPGYKVVPISEMKPGDIVMWGSGHTNFCYTANNGRYTFVGGNQIPGPQSSPPVRDPQNDGDVTISYPTGWIPSLGGITKVIRLDC